ncbi:chemotaxis protein CheC [Inhella gelatinilytica]|uniref:Chemotaxis protein CheC n=1 Tax=Inhella gelatinilytica TaxID=2795030 RepID=A0A931IZA0_9BURK|nr:chemotaxis protein CheC [Inhella gelatinilytica]MBH9552541.1 chemotaxis protein CheC [Inhella gelatinilytica]
MSIELGELERDALGEAFNMALGEAAASFSELVQEEIRITVPHVQVVARADLVSQLGDLSIPGLSERLTAITQAFHTRDQSLNTEAWLVFSETSGLDIVRRMLGEAEMPLDQITELEQDALGEMGNIIINGCMNTLATILGSELVGGLPEVAQSPAAQLFPQQEEDGVVLVVRIGLSLQSQNITGYVLFLMDLPSLDLMVQRVRAYFGLDAGA